MAAGTLVPNGARPDRAAAPGATTWRGAALVLAVGLLGALAAGRLAIQVSRLVAGGPEVFGAVDLGFRFREVQRWFAGEPVYGALDTAVYPPATHVLLWPFLGWTDFASARLLWALTGLLALAALSALFARGSAVTGKLPITAVFLLPAAGYAAGVTLAAGQMMVHLLPAVLGGVLLLARPGRPSLRRDTLAAVLLLAALAKPNATLPLVGLAWVLPRRLRPFLLTTAGYLALTLLALSFQPAGPLQLARDWLPTARGVAAVSGHGHLGVALGALGLERLLLPASLLLLLAWLTWAARHRDADLWVLLGIGAIVARVFTYHQYYDDLLLLAPLAALLRLAQLSRSPAIRRTARSVFVLALLAALAPTHLHALAAPWAFLLFELPQMLTWAAMLGVLIPEARRPALACEVVRSE